MNGHVSLRELRCAATQGNPPEPTELLVDVTITIDLARVAETDEFDDVVDLADLAVSVRKSMAATPRKLLETLAAATARGVLARYARVQAVRVRVVKHHPAGLDAAEESVELELTA